jgi:CheY-like chemotaxis protein
VLCEASLGSTCRTLEEEEDQTAGEQPGAQDTLTKPISNAQELSVLTGNLLEVKKGFMVCMMQPIFQIREEQQVSKEVSTLCFVDTMLNCKQQYSGKWPCVHCKSLPHHLKPVTDSCNQTEIFPNKTKLTYHM